MKRTFRVLLIDDAEQVLERVAREIPRDVVVEGTALTIRIEVEPLHVELEKSAAGEYSISMSTIQALAKICHAPFDFIFADFAFVADRERNTSLRNTLLSEGKQVETSDIAGWVLALRDIKKRFDHETSEGTKATEDLATNDMISIHDNFLHHKGRVQVYTNSPPPFSNYFDGYALTERENEIKSVFPGATVGPLIRLHVEFGISAEIDQALKGTRPEQDFYTLLLSRHLEWLIRRAALHHMVRAQDKLRVRNTLKAFTKLTLFSVVLGTVVAVFGEVDYHFFKEALDTFVRHSSSPTPWWLNVLGGVLFTIVIVSIVSIVGLLYSLFIERQMGGLLDKEG